LKKLFSLRDRRYRPFDEVRPGDLRGLAADAASLRLSPGVPAGREELAKLGSMQKILAANLRYSRNISFPS